MSRGFGPVGMIDIGSNSVRFVAYAGAERVPAALFNEKVTAALGQSVGDSGRLDPEAMATALAALDRFNVLARQIGVRKLTTVATAAVRDASNGREFLKQVSALGLKPRLLTGAEEAYYSALGVVSAIPRAAGVVADLGGGSLELAGVARGLVGTGVSLPIGVLRETSGVDAAALGEMIERSGEARQLGQAGKDHRLYLVGGSFRALATFDMKLARHPLPIVHQHFFAPGRLAELGAALAGMSPSEIKSLTRLSGNRVASLPAALALAGALVAHFQPNRVVLSSFGLREGLLYHDLPPNVRAEDPLLAAALEVGERLGRFGDHGALLDQWIDPLFVHEPPSQTRLRLATCLLADIAWNAHPDFRAERAVDLAVHGNWVGIGAHGRALLGRALCSAFGGESGFPRGLASLIDVDEAERASLWGRAIRLAQRLSGGTEALLKRSAIALGPRTVTLTMPRRYRALYSDAVERRHRQLALAMKREPRLELD